MRAKAHRVGFGVLAFLTLFLGINAAHAVAKSIHASQSSNEDAVNSKLTKKSIHRTWQIGGFVAGGFPPYYTVHAPLLHYQEDLRFYSAGLEAGRTVTAIHGPKFLRGRGEAVVEVIPYWQVSRPAQTVAIYLPGRSAPSLLGDVASYSIHGASITPLQFRWNFLKKDTSRFVPWIQPGIGLLWTNQDFPQGYGDAAKPPIVTTSKINFTPQLDLGENIFVHKNQSISLSVQAIHITNFGRTTYNPGVNIIVEFKAGYSWWK